MSDLLNMRVGGDAAAARNEGQRRHTLEDTRVGTSVASFEELLARELAKTPPPPSATTTTSSNNSNSSSKHVKRPFLKRGDRGWWMKRPGASARIRKPVLTSKDVDGGPESSSNNSNSSRTTTLATSASQRSSQPYAAAKKPPERQQRQMIRSPPPPETVTRQVSRSNAVRHSIERMPAPRLSDSMRTTVSVDTLGMSHLRASYEAQREREAEELADFEAIERELAAEKDAYFLDKQRAQQQHEDDALLERNNAVSPKLSEQLPRSREPPTQRHSVLDEADDDENLELDGHSSLLFGEDARAFPPDDDDSDRFESASLFSLDQRRVSDHFATGQLLYAASELSAISLNDSESWGDPASPQDIDSASLSQRHGAAGGLLGAAADSRSHGYGSFDDAAPLYREGGAFSDDMSNEGGKHKTEPKRSHNAPPVSELMQQFFGARSSDAYVEYDDNGDDEYNTSRDSDHSQEELEADRFSAPQRSRTRPTQRAPRVHSKASQGAALRAASSARAPRSANAKGGSTSTSARTRTVSASSNGTKQASASHAKTSRGVGGGGAILPVVIEEKLFELEEEVKFYKAETLQLQKKKDAFDQAAKKLAREREEFTKFQHEQRELMEKAWAQERAKMRRDEKLLERQVKLKLSAAAAHHGRKERGEIDALRAQIVKLQLDEKARAAKWKAMNDSLRQRIVELEEKNHALGDEIKFLERERLEQWGKYEALLKERHRPVDPPTSARNSSHVELNAAHDLRTVNDLFAVKDTAEALLKGWQSRGDEEEDGDSEDNDDGAAASPLLKGVGDKEARGYGNNLQGEQESNSNERPVTRQVAREVVQPGGKREIIFTDGSRKILFADGNEKEVDADGHTTIRFTNGDRKETTLTTFPDKTKVYEFPNKQVEKSYPDGTTEISFADGITKTIRPTGDEFSVFPDGTTLLERKDGLREVTLRDQKKIRYYPDGAMAWLTPQGQETPVRSDTELRKLIESVQ